MKQDFYVDAAYESLNHYGEELCGDKVEFVRADDSFIAVLADGLGSGVKANILATLTSKIIATMLAKGSSLHAAVETIAKTLPVCSQRGIAYSTFTVVKLNRDDGAMTIVDFDNPASVIFRDGVLFPIEPEALEIEGKTIYRTNLTARAGDMVVSFSDGIVHAGIGSLLDLGWMYENVVQYLTENVNEKMSAVAVVKKLLSATNTLYMDKPGDDCTVCAMRVMPSNPVTVMVGPPVNQEMDKAVVDKLMRAKGMKVVCGGTTSQIVSRVTGRELNVSIDYDNPAVPPTATLQGIDLITEGVLTLGKSLEQIKKITAGGPQGLEEYNLNKHDGATRLTKMLLEDSTRVQFLVGRALNPAHQNPGMPVSLGLKLNLIKELAAEVEKTGKKVEIEYF